MLFYFGRPWLPPDLNRYPLGSGGNLKNRPRCNAHFPTGIGTDAARCFGCGAGKTLWVFFGVVFRASVMVPSL